MGNFPPNTRPSSPAKRSWRPSGVFGLKAELRRLRRLRPRRTRCHRQRRPRPARDLKILRRTRKDRRQNRALWVLSCQISEVAGQPTNKVPVPKVQLKFLPPIQWKRDFKVRPQEGPLPPADHVWWEGFPRYIHSMVWGNDREKTMSFLSEVTGRTSRGRRPFGPTLPLHDLRGVKRDHNNGLYLIGTSKTGLKFLRSINLVLHYYNLGLMSGGVSVGLMGASMRLLLADGSCGKSLAFNNFLSASFRMYKRSR